MSDDPSVLHYRSETRRLRESLATWIGEFIRLQRLIDEWSTAKQSGIEANLAKAELALYQASEDFATFTPLRPPAPLSAESILADVCALVLEWEADLQTPGGQQTSPRRALVQPSILRELKKCLRMPG